MPSTYELIKGETISTAAASYTFTAIPSTYTDLVLRVSARSDSAGSYSLPGNVTINGATTNYSETYLEAQGTSATSSRGSIGTFPFWYVGVGKVNGPLSTADTFHNSETYFPNYAGSQQKIGSVFGIMETNSSNDNYIYLDALKNTTTSAISSITIDCAGNLTAGSSFYLYGIKNS